MTDDQAGDPAGDPPPAPARTATRLRRGRCRGALGAAVAAMAILVGTVATPAEVGTATGAAPPTGGILLALGDSLAAGYQPTDGRRLPPTSPSSGLPDQGYPGGYARAVAAAEHLHLVDLACPGETTASFAGRPAQPACATLYRAATGARSQLGAALAFLATHRGTVRLVTIDLGANDVVGCQSGSTVSLSCVRATTVRVRARLDHDLARLAAALHADDPTARLAGMTYYDPFLALAYQPGGLAGLAEAAFSLAAVGTFDAALTTVYRAHGAVVADVAGAFDTGRSRPVETYRGVRLALDAAVVCRLTWMCPLPHHATPDIHPTTAGYARIAAAFVAALRRAPAR